MKKGIVCLFVFAVITMAQQEVVHADSSLLQSCPDYFQHNMPTDVAAPNGYGTYFLTGQGFSNEGCWGFTWFRSNTANIGPIYFSARMYWNGPNIATSAWDCNHSTITYGVFTQPGGPGTTVTWVGGGSMFGQLVGGTCTYKVSNPPGGWGTDYVRVTGSQYQDYWIAVQQWAHNDPNIGHPGNLCASDSCYFSPKIRLGKEPY
jgi:hypothetical protein